MTRAGSALLRAYLGLFAYFAPNRAHVRREHSLIESSLRETYEEYRVQRGRVGAALMAVREHISELWPHALIAKTLADCASTRPDHRYVLRLASGLGGLAVLGSIAFIALGSQASGETVGTIGRVFPSGDRRAGQVESVAEADSLQESVYIATGGRVCIDPDLTGADLGRMRAEEANEVVNGTSTSEELERCAHYTLPD